jgi:hypothetical protein
MAKQAGFAICHLRLFAIQHAFFSILLVEEPVKKWTSPAKKKRPRLTEVSEATDSHGDTELPETTRRGTDGS